MLPALTFVVRPRAPRRLIAAGVGGALLAVALAGSLLSGAGQTPASGQPQLLVDRLAPATWALALPSSWLAAPVAEVRSGQSVDLLAVRMGDRPLAIAIAADLRVMSVGDGAIVFQVDEDAATAIASARASGLLIVPLVRSTR
jgi:hypothetical protein